MDKLRTYLVAGEGDIWTNGEIYGKEIYLAEDMNEDDFYIISDAEYDAMQAEQAAEMTPPM